MKRTRISLAFIALTFLCISVFSVTAAADSDKIRVKVEVVGDRNVDREVKKYVSRALDSMLDVETVDESPRIYVHIIARRLVTNRGRRLGYVISSATSEIIDMVIDGGYPFTCSDYNGLWLETGPDLRSLCAQCVDALDSGVLNRMRAVDLNDPQ